jgi:malonate decarboxylase beta subunit
MNGPEVIEQEAGVGELDAADRAVVWSLIGGEQRQAVGLADDVVEDDAAAIAAVVRAAVAHGVPAEERSAQVERFVRRLAAIDPRQPPDGMALRALWGEAAQP